MALKDIPIVGIGPGSQPGEADGAQLSYLAMPKEMSVYQKPLLPEPDEVRHMTGAMQTMEWLQAALDGYRAQGEPLIVDISGLDAPNRDLVNQILGEGEVSAQYNGAFRARMQESVLAGVWRTFLLDPEQRPVRDLIEVSDVPLLARLSASSDAPPRPDQQVQAPPAQLMNAMPILTEVSEHLEGYQAGQQAHVINLTLLPLSPEDLSFLDQALGSGPASLLSRGYGDCAITSTAFPNLWWVRYYNSTGALILNTLEVVDVPIVARAAVEDIEASGARLKDILEPYLREDA